MRGGKEGSVKRGKEEVEVEKDMDRIERERGSKEGKWGLMKEEGMRGIKEKKNKTNEK